jgi:hypothetical protein
MTDIKFQGLAPIEWPVSIVTSNIDQLNGFLPIFMREEMSDILLNDGSAVIFVGMIFNHKNSEFLFHIHKLIESHVVTVHLLNDGDDVLLIDPIICKNTKRFRVLVLAPISSERLIEACDILIAAGVHDS